MGESLKHKTIKGVGWSAIERFSVQGVSFVIQIILARLLTPADYGIIGMLAIFMQIAQVFIDSGFANALIQKQDCTDVDYSTVFYYNLFISIAIWGLLFFLAPLVANFYSQPILIPVMRTISVTLILNALCIVQRTILVKEVDFKSQSKVTMTSALLSGFLGIFLAYKGQGVWSLVVQQISNSLFQAVLYFILVRWSPKLVFSKQSFKALFDFGSKLLGASLIGVLYHNLYTIVIGKKFSAETLGLYSRAEQFSSFPSTNICQIVSRVSFPILSEIQGDDNRLAVVYRKFIQYCSLAIFPIMVSLCVLARPFVIVILSDTWIEVVPLLMILCSMWMFDHLCVLNLNLLYVKGRSDLVLRLEIIKKTIAVSILLFSMHFGVIWMCVGRLLYEFIAISINCYYTKKLIHFGLLDQVKDILPYLLFSLMMAIVTLTFLKIIDNVYIQLFGGIAVSLFTYCLFLVCFKRTQVRDIIEVIKHKI